MLIKAKKLLKIICFLLLFFLLFNWVSGILQEKYVAYDTLAETYITDQFNELEPDSIELAFLGSSQIIRGISCMHLLEDYHISAFSPATGTQPMMCTYYYAQRLLKTQNLKAVVIDVSTLYEKIRESNFRRTADAAPWSIDKLKLLWHYTKYRAKKEGNQEAFRSLCSYVFPIMQFHDRWNLLTKDDFAYQENGPFVFRGNATRIDRMLFDGFIIDDQPVDESVHPRKHQLSYFKRTLNLLQDAGVKVVLIKTPKLGWTRSNSKGVQKIADEYGIDYLDFNTQAVADAAGFDFTTDIADQEHLNFSGAFKLTDYLAEYLSKDVDFTDAVLTEKDEQDLADFHRLLRKNDMLLTGDPDEFLTLAQDDDCSMLVTVDAGVEIPEVLKQKFSELGFHTDLFGKNSYAGVMSGGTVIDEKTAEGELTYSYVLPNQLSVNVTNFQNTPGVWLNSVVLKQIDVETPLTIPGNGLHVVVFADRYPEIKRAVTLTADETGIHFV